MKGYIKIEAGTHEGQEGLFVGCHIEDVSTMDRCMLMHSLKKALQMDGITWKLYVIGEHEGLFDEATEMEDLTDVCRCK